MDAPLRTVASSASAAPRHGTTGPSSSGSQSNTSHVFHGPHTEHIALEHLTTEARNPASEALDGLSTVEIVRVMNAEDARVAEAVGREAEAIATVIDVVADRLKTGGRLVYTGAGTSGRLGVLDASECPPTFNTDPSMVVGIIAGGKEALTTAVEGAEDSPEQGASDLQAINLGPNDVLVGIATSGRTPYVVGALRHARSIGAYTVSLSCNEAAEIIPMVDQAITPVVGPEVLSGSTRLKAGTATKLVLNTITTGAMVKLGKTFGNLMVDLRPTNSKLHSRAVRIVGQATGLHADDARDLLAQCGGEVKVAIVSHLGKADPDEARRRLASSNGQVGQSVGH